MHEASLCDALFDQVDAAIANHTDHDAAATAVVREIHVAIGELAGVDPELFQLAFDTLHLDRHPSATLTLVHVPARWRCPTCANIHTPNTPLTCTVCNDPLTLASGGKLTLQRIELTLTQPEAPHV